MIHKTWRSAVYHSKGESFSKSPFWVRQVEFFARNFVLFIPYANNGLKEPKEESRRNSAKAMNNQAFSCSYFSGALNIGFFN